MSKEASALTMVRDAMCQATQPISLCSFGKDSLVVLHLCLRVRKVPAMCWRLSKFHEKQQQQHRVSQLWDLEVYDTWPLLTYDYANHDFFEVMHVYGTGTNRHGQHGIIAMATGAQPYDGEERFLCAKTDLLHRPTLPAPIWPWDVTFHGHKSVDDPECGSSANITNPISLLGNTLLVCPIHDWTDDDVWSYIEHYDLPYDRGRYDLGEKSQSPDHYPTCWNCRDPRHRNESVYCPKDERLMMSEARTQEDHERDHQLLRHSLNYCEVSGEPRTTPNVTHA